MSIAAWMGAILVGLTLGLLGSGGSILTVPILVYLVGQPEKVAIAGSLGIVGGIALVGAVTAASRRKVDGPAVALFGLPSMAGTYGGAWAGGFVSGAAQLVVFSLVMLLAAGLMLRPRAAGSRASGRHRAPALVLAVQGLAIGLLTGFVGVGGGFIIVPALVLLGGLPIHVAVGTSLTIIALKSFAGFWKYLDVLRDAGLGLDWPVLVTFTALGAAGSLGGNLLGGRVSPDRLRRGFAVFLVIAGTLMLWQNVPRAL